MTTRIAHPILEETVLAHANVVDFNVGSDVIESQLLSYILRHEMSQPQSQQSQKEKAFREREKDSEKDRDQEYQEYHDQLLMALAASEGDVLDNETLVTMLSQTRNTMMSIKVSPEVESSSQRKQGKKRYN